MAIAQYFSGVLIRVSDLDARYPGGADGFRADYGRGMLLDDGEILGMSFMGGRDVDDFLDELGQKSGLRINLEHQSGECCLTLYQSALNRPTWVEGVMVLHPEFGKPWQAWRLRGGTSVVLAYSFPHGPSMVPLEVVDPEPPDA